MQQGGNGIGCSRVNKGVYSPVKCLFTCDWLLHSVYSLVGHVIKYYGITQLSWVFGQWTNKIFPFRLYHMYIHLRADALWLIYRIQPSGNILFVYLENYGYLLFDWFWLDDCNEMNPTTKRENSTVLSSQLDFPIFGVRHILFIHELQLITIISILGIIVAMFTTLNTSESYLVFVTFAMFTAHQTIVLKSNCLVCLLF